MPKDSGSFAGYLLSLCISTLVFVVIALIFALSPVYSKDLEIRSYMAHLVTAMFLIFVVVQLAVKPIWTHYRGQN